MAYIFHFIEYSTIYPPMPIKYIACIAIFIKSGSLEIHTTQVFVNGLKLFNLIWVPIKWVINRKMLNEARI